MLQSECQKGRKNELKQPVVATTGEAGRNEGVDEEVVRKVAARQGAEEKERQAPATKRISTHQTPLVPREASARGLCSGRHATIVAAAYHPLHTSTRTGQAIDGGRRARTRRSSLQQSAQLI